MQTITFSVIMPCYNSRDYVRSALDSLLGQSWPHWELVAVNDGSKDETPEILQEYAAKDPRIRVFSKENGGYVSAVNMGLEQITGDYFLLMGSDDALAPEIFEKLAAAMEDRSPDCIAFQTEIIQDGVNLGVESITQFREGAAKAGTDLAEFAAEYPEQSEIFFTRDTSKAWRREILGDLRYFGHYGLDADGIFSMLLCHRAGSFQVMPVTGYYWTKRGDSLSGRKRSFPQTCDCVENWIRFFREVNLKDYTLCPTEKMYLRYLIRLLQTLAEEGTCEQESLIRDAAAVIRETAARAGYDLDLSRKDRLLLRAPRVWKRMHRLLP